VKLQSFLGLKFTRLQDGFFVSLKRYIALKYFLSIKDRKKIFPRDSVRPRRMRMTNLKNLIDLIFCVILQFRGDGMMQRGNQA
jgi:hypothetical protein